MKCIKLTVRGITAERENMRNGLTFDDYHEIVRESVQDISICPLGNMACSGDCECYTE